MKSKILYALALALCLTACRYGTPNPFEEDSEATIAQLTQDGRLYTLQEFKDSFMTENGNYCRGELYRTRANNGDSVWLFSLDTLPKGGPSIYIMGRIATDDYGGNYYKTLVLQQMVNIDGQLQQQNIRVGVDMGSLGGIYQIGQQILIRCNGLSVGRYANQPQLCVPSYNNNINAQNAGEKVGWLPGRIPTSRFVEATHLIGLPDRSRIYYEEMTINDMQTRYMKDYANIVRCRQYDGRLVRLKDVHYTGEYFNTTVDAKGNCGREKLTIYNPLTDSIGNPEKDKNANVFGPTTENVGFPQSRVISNSDETLFTSVSCSEYCKYARYYLPSVIRNNFHDFDYKAVRGDIQGVMGYFMDNAGYEPNTSKFSITPCDLTSDFDMTCHVPAVDGSDSTFEWIPIEFAMYNFVDSLWTK